MHPTDVQPKKFQGFTILYNHNDFAIALGKYYPKKYRESPERLAMRWNEAESNKIGYPRQGKNPTWFMLPEELTNPFLKALLNEVKRAERKTILKVLKQTKTANE
jgi:hypothetical protein